MYQKFFRLKSNKSINLVIWFGFKDKMQSSDIISDVPRNRLADGIKTGIPELSNYTIMLYVKISINKRQYLFQSRTLDVFMFYLL